MPKIVRTINSDENTYQIEFYKQLFGEDYYEKVSINRSTDGYIDGTIFEHKNNVKSYGMSKALSQALIYLCRFNRDGIPVPKNIMLVSQEEELVYLFNANDYIKIINDINKYANMQASLGIPNFKILKNPEVIEYKLNASGLSNLIRILDGEPEYVKVDVSIDNVYGWSIYFYQHSNKPTKLNLFRELRLPKNVLLSFINPWKGTEKDFSLIMDLLNDPATQKKTGAFYTPPQYSYKTAELVLEAIKRVPKGQDYIIIDRCAGTGALEYELDDEILSHIIISTYELKEWHALKDRLGGLVRYIIPPIPKQKNKYPKVLNGTSLLEGTNALTEEFIKKMLVLINKLKKTKEVTIILLENPPFRDIAAQDKDITGIEDKTFVYYEFIKSGTEQAAHREVDNLFIWSGFKYFLTKNTDSYILISPIKYFKNKKLGFVNKKRFIRGYAFNRKHFHNSEAMVSSILWSNEDIKKENEFITLEAFDIVDNKCVIPDVQYLKIKSVNNASLNTFNPQKIKDKKDVPSKIVCTTKGRPLIYKGNEYSIYNKNIIGYLRATSFNFNANSWCLTRTITSDALSQHYGFYLRESDFENYLPLFVAKLYPTKYWYEKDIYFTSADGGDRFRKDKKFIKKCIIYTCLCQHNHCCSFEINKTMYKNELCFDGSTVAKKRLFSILNQTNKLTGEEQELIDEYNQILKYSRKRHSKKMKAGYTYGLYQLDEDVNTKHIIIDKNGNEKSVYDDGDLNEMIKNFKSKILKYYENNIKFDMLEYELVK